MTQEEIIEMARQAGFTPYGQRRLMVELEAFAKLVAAHTLSNIDPTSFISYQEGVKAGRLAEREACAKAAEDFLTNGRSPLGRSVGNAIRARGES